MGEEYWGARVMWGHSPKGLARYTDGPELPPDFTQAAGDSNVATIALIRARIMAQHPEDISVLADYWYNAYNLLEHIGDQIRAQAHALERQWESPEARDEFLMRGPGTALAYLDEWKTAAYRNAQSLWAAAQIAVTSRSRMEALWTAYRQAISDALYVTADEYYDRFPNPGLMDGYPGPDLRNERHYYPGSRVMNNMYEIVMDHLDATRRDFNHRAQVLAFEVATEYWGAMRDGLGQGPPFMPMNAVFNPPEAPRGFPGGPPAMPAMPPTPTMPAMPALPTMPPVPAMPGMPPVPTSPTGPGVPGTGPVPGGVPVPLPALPPGALSHLPSAVVARLAASGMFHAPGQLGSGLPMLPPTPPRGVIRRPQARQATAAGEPSPALQSPMAPPSTPTPARPTPQRPDPAVHGPAPTEEVFAVPPGSAAPPVLRGAPSDPRRRAPSGPAAGARSAQPPAGAAPPVLGAPARSTGPMAPAQPTPRRAGSVRSGEGDTDWLGLDAARAGRPVLDAPAAAQVTPPADGRGVLRAHPSLAAEVVPAELSTRRAVPPPTTPADATEQGVQPVEAFTVDTPGGAVVAKNRDAADQRPEPPAALSAR